MLTALSGKTVLLTGGTGFIGGHLLKRLLLIPDIKLVVVSRKGAIPLPHTNVIQISCPLDQLTRQTWITSGIKRIETVFHLGAYTPKNAIQANDIDGIFNANILGTRALLDSLPHPPEKIIFSSTLDVYASPAPDPIITEASPLDPPSLYGASKLFCEHLLKTYGRNNCSTYTILRYGHIYGPGEMAYAKLIPQTIKTLLKNESPVIYGNGSATRDFMFVGDAVEATLRAAITRQLTPEPINIVSGNAKPVREFVDTLAKLTGFTGVITYDTEKPGGHSLKFDNSRMRSVLGSWELVPLEEGLQAEIGYLRELP